jgi:hypothetical protein
VIASDSALRVLLKMTKWDFRLYGLMALVYGGLTAWSLHRLFSEAPSPWTAGLTVLYVALTVWSGRRARRALTKYGVILTMIETGESPYLPKG